MDFKIQPALRFFTRPEAKVIASLLGLSHSLSRVSQENRYLKEGVFLAHFLI